METMICVLVGSFLGSIMSHIALDWVVNKRFNSDSPSESAKE